MKKIVIALLVPIMISNNIIGTVVWTDTSAPDAINENLVILNDTQLGVGTTFITASTQDVTVEIEENSRIACNDASQSTLIISATYPHQVLFKVTKNMRFRGRLNDLLTPLLIYEMGDGFIAWELDSDSKLSFDSSDESGGTELWIQHTIGLGFPHHTFEVKKNFQVKFGTRCKFGYRVFGFESFDGEALVEADDASHNQSTIQFKDESGFFLQLVAP